MNGDIERQLDRLDSHQGCLLVLLMIVFACIISISSTLSNIEKKIDDVQKSNVRSTEK